MSVYYQLPIVTDQDALLDRFYTQMAEAFAGWTPAEGNLEVWIARWVAQITSDLGVMAGLVADEIFMRFGQDLVAITPIPAAPASAPTTWTMVDDAGYTIPSGARVDIALSGDESVGFVVLDDVEVPAGATATDPGAVIVVAVLDGEQGNGLTATPTLSDALTFVDSIVLEAATSGGTDAEDPLLYRNRLATELQTLADHPILPDDVSILARKIAGVARAAALDGYNPGDNTYDNERMVAVAVIDEDGNAVSAPAKAAVDASLQARREVNFVFNVIDPTSHTIAVTTTVKGFAGFDPGAVQAEVEGAITAYLSPANWGKGPADTSSAEWRNVTAVRRFELIAAVSECEGVDYVTALTLGIDGGSLGTSDLTMSGPAPLPTAGTLSVTVT